MNTDLEHKSSSTESMQAEGSEALESRLRSLVGEVLDQARARGASGAEVAASAHQALSVTVRLGEVETLEHSRDSGLGITVYFGQRKGTASSADLSEVSIATSLDQACDIARFTEEDECAGLADAERMAAEFPDLDLWHPRAMGAEAAIDMARDMEQAALSHHDLIRNSEGGTVTTGESVSAYANTHGFLASRRGTRHSLSCVVLAQDQDSMQRDYWYDTRRAWSDLQAPVEIGRRAAERAVARHGARSIATCKVPILFTPDTARGLLRHLVSAISGGNLYRGSSFLRDHLGETIFPSFIRIEEQPFEPRGLRSAHYDNEGVATDNRVIVEDGVLRGYILGSYSARKLGMASTANAGGTHNLTLAPGSQGFEELVSDMGRGLVVTELMGHGFNVVTGDYSRGATGFWVENGELTHSVEGITIAGNLKSMFSGIVAAGNDLDTRSGIRCGSVLIDQMTIAGD